jgi:hypothetical protein
VGIYTPNERITLSATWVYGTGNAVTMPQADYEAPSNTPSGYQTEYNNYYFPQNATYYGEKNNFRMAAYHRFDIGIQFHKKKRWGERTWEISFYNAYNRKNPFFYMLQSDYVGPDQTETRIKQISLFPILPSVSYGFKF